jgi:hypothetical protein
MTSLDEKQTTNHTEADEMHPDPYIHLRLYHEEMERTYAKADLVRQARLARRQAAAGYDMDDPIDARETLVAAVLRRVAMIAGLRSARQPGV